MNIFNTPQIMGTTKGANEASGNVLDGIGNHKQLTPEQAQALQKLGKIKKDSGSFETILKESQNLQMPSNQENSLELLSTGKEQVPETKLRNESVQVAPNNLMQSIQTKSPIQNAAQANSEILTSTSEHSKLAKNMLEAQATPNLNVQNIDILNQSVEPIPTDVSQMQSKLPLDQKINSEVGTQKMTTSSENDLNKILNMGQTNNAKEMSAPKSGLNIAQVGPQVPAQSAQMNSLLQQQMPVSAMSMAAIPTASIIAGNKLATEKAPVKNSNLMDFDTFMKKQNPQTRGRINSQHQMYENKNKSMFNTKIESSLPHVVTKPEGQTKLQDVMFGSNSNEMSSGLDQQMNNSNIQVMAKAAPVAVGADQVAKVFDISTMNSSMNSDEVIAKIQDYAIQTKFSKEPQLDFSFTDKDLGQIDLRVQKIAGDQVNITIGSNSDEGLKFFTQHKGELIQSLAHTGITVADMKLDSSAKSNNQSFSQNSHGNGNDAHREHQSESGQRQEEKQKRSELWDQLRDKEAA